MENVCFLNQCLNGGTCMEVMGSHSCLCMDGFSGSVCESELLFHLVVCTKTSCSSRVNCVLDHYLYFGFICLVFVSFCCWCFICLLTGYKWYPQWKISEKWEFYFVFKAHKLLWTVLVSAVIVWILFFFQLKADVVVTLAEMEEHVMTITTLTPVLV